MRVLAALIASLALPAGGVQWWNVTAVGRSLLVTGSPPTGARCEFFVVDTPTLKRRGPYRRSCYKPPISTHPLPPLVVYSHPRPSYPVTLAAHISIPFH